ncbi:E3 ubiquitin/ISG15 ligase TRIM25 [Xenopus tropicalis]|uniref:E3 ubiquitin/ISG15 ligase TRIM25 n=1 Tax=Xenopus tropicalis TaxID=8364 RepID=A0A8J1JXT4_XENTR|nr:E3 ubiquitin/ISG15 ligase TRIM25 [Xenopus tropicalis]
MSGIVILSLRLNSTSAEDAMEVIKLKAKTTANMLVIMAAQLVGSYQFLSFSLIILLVILVILSVLMSWGGAIRQEEVIFGSVIIFRRGGDKTSPTGYTDSNVQFCFLFLISAMAAADLRDELSCSICTSIYTDPVSLPCGHNFCRGCIGRTWDWQEGIEEDPSCPECRQRFKRRPELATAWKLRGLVERFRPTETALGKTGIFCTYCLLSPVPAAKSCLLCEASLCDTHLRGHCQSAEHVLTEPTASFMGRKCSVHNEPLKYHCCEDSACICASCCLAGGHRGHRVELLSEASEKKKEKLRKVLEKLSPEREETERGAQRLQERRREAERKAAGETERVTALFRGIREELEALEKRVLGDVSRQREELSLPFNKLINRLEFKKDELSRKIRHIEELCNMADPLTVLQEQWESHGAAFCGAEGADNKGREREGIKDPAVGDLDVGRISETLLTGLAGIVTGVKEWWISGQIHTGLVLDINTAGNHVSVSGDRKSASYSLTELHCKELPLVL